MPSIKRIIEKSDTAQGKAFDLTMQTLIILSIITFSVETLPDLEEQTRYYLRMFEVITVSIFTIEYISRFIVATSKKAFVFSFFGIVDMLSILPFYLSTGLDLRAVRMLRLFRLFRILKLVRYNAAMNRFKSAFAIAKEELMLFLFATMAMFYLSGVGIYYFENEAQPEAFSSIFHSLWWSVITLTTVGYGDIYPITAGGKIFTFFILIIGLGIVSIPAGLIASALSKARTMESDED
ncbi:MAG: voltage-gated potassium channel [Kangiella sp.]|nr:MAG: voltage-gated potassium channel [Kangiella sp.]